MKKIFSLLLAVVMVISLFPVIGVSAATPNSSLDKYKITLDPGHGYNGSSWTGATGAMKWGGEQEDFYNWRIANQTKATLEAAGVKVYMTKSSLEANPGFQSRIDTATNNGSGTFVSIHNNSSDSSSASGSQVFIGNYNYLPDCDARSEEMGITIQNRLRDDVGIRVNTRPYSSDSGSSTYPDGSVQDYWGIIQRGKRARLWACLIVECCFQSNQSDVQTFLLNPQKVLDMGTAIANGIMEYYGITGTPYETTLDSESGASAQNAVVKVNKTLTKGVNNTLNVSGWSVHGDGVSSYEYRVGDGSWQAMAGSFRQDVADAKATYDKCTTLNAFSQNIDISSLPSGKSTVQIRGLTKAGEYYDIANYELFMYPAAGTTYMNVEKTRYALNDAIKITAKGDAKGAWVGLFGANETPGDVASYYWFEMHNGVVTINDLFKDGTANSRASSITPGAYKLVAFVDADYTIDPNVPAVSITLTGKKESCLDSPSSGSSLSKGELLHVAGWGIHPDGIAKYEISIDNGEFFTLDTKHRQDVLNAFPDYAASCADVNGFADDISTSELTVADHTAVVRAVTKSGDTFSIGTVTFTVTPAKYDGKITVNSTADITIDRTGTETLVLGVSPELTVEEVISQFEGDYIITTADGKEVTSFVGSGCIIKLAYEGAYYDAAVIIVKADVDGDGLASAKDIIRAKKYRKDNTVECFEKAADLNSDGVVDANDIKLITQLCIG